MLDLLLEELSLTGSFNDWKTPLALRVGSENGDFVRSIALPPGQYQVAHRSCQLPTQGQTDSKLLCIYQSRDNNFHTLAGVPSLQGKDILTLFNCIAV